MQYQQQKNNIGETKPLKEGLARSFPYILSPDNLNVTYKKMNKDTSEILEQYIEGKDSDNYQLLEKIYLENAVVEFEISSDQITFPDKIHGNKDIARVLSKDFNRKYTEVKTYYLSKPTNNKSNIYQQKWLVVMKEILSNKTRVGTGYYDWEFSTTNTGIKIQKHKIYIHEMASIEDAQMSELSRIQNSLPYPWVRQREARDALTDNCNLDVITQYLG